jgi:Flp pilus assembly protein TadB
MNVHSWILVLCGIISICVLVLLVIVAVSGSSPKVVFKAYEGVVSGLRNSEKMIFHYDHIHTYLEKKGASFHFGAWVDPIRYLALRIVLLIVGFFVGNLFGVWYSMAAEILFFFLPAAFLTYLNAKDNERLLPELKLVYHALAMQIKAGVYVSDALTECYGSVQEDRLRQALLDLSAELVMKSDFGEALEKLQSKFDNRYIDSLCITLFQAQESGQAVELLSDIAEQIKDMEVTLLTKKKGALDRNVTFYQLGIFAVVIGVVLYACVQNIFQAISFF